MKLSHKTLVAGAVIAFAVMGTTFAEGELKFENEISTDTYLIGDTFNDNTRFAGIQERIQGEYTSEKVDINLNLTVRVLGYNVEVAGEKRIRFAFENYPFRLNDSYLKFRPIDTLQLAISTSDGTEKASGSFFPVLDSYSDCGNYTGNFGLLFRPIEKLSIGVGVDLTNYIFSNVNDNDNQLTLNFGAEYEVENIGAFALTFNNVINNFSIGAYAKISAVQAMDIYTGFSFQKNTDMLIQKIYFSNLNNVFWGGGIGGKLLLNAGIGYTGVDKLLLAGELATNLFTEADGYHDLYTGFKAEYDINESFSVGGNVGMFFDIVDSRNTEYLDYRSKTDIYICPGVTYKLGHNTFKAGFIMNFYNDAFYGAIPLSWKYSF